MPHGTRQLGSFIIFLITAIVIIFPLMIATGVYLPCITQCFTRIATSFKLETVWGRFTTPILQMRGLRPRGIKPISPAWGCKWQKASDGIPAQSPPFSHDLFLCSWNQVCVQVYGARTRYWENTPSFWDMTFTHFFPATCARLLLNNRTEQGQGAIFSPPQWGAGARGSVGKGTHMSISRQRWLSSWADRFLHIL